MKILALTHLYPRPGRELFGSYNGNQIRALARDDEVRVVAPIAWTDRLKRMKGPAGAYQNQDGIWVEHPTFYFSPRVLGHRYGEFYLASVRKTVTKVIEEFEPEVMYSTWAHPDGWAAVRLARERGLPVVIKVLGSDVLVVTRSPRRRERVAEALREADGVIAVSRDLAQHVAGLGVDGSRIHVVPEGIDKGLFCPGDAKEAQARLGITEAEGARLLFVGNLLLTKGAGVLLEACALLKQRGMKFRCTLLGRGKDQGRLVALCGRLGLEEVVDFPGAFAQAKLPDWYRACDLTVLPSFSEGIPNVLREAMMCGRGFVATNVGGIPEITRPEVGRLVEPGDPKQLADAIQQALADGLTADPAVARELNISWEQSARMLADVARGAIQSKAGKRD